MIVLIILKYEIKKCVYVRIYDFLNDNLFCMHAGGADLLDATRIRDVPLGVEKTTGICDNRVQTVLDEETVLEAISDPNSIRGSGGHFVNRSEPIQTGPDLAYTLSVRAVLSVNTGQIFPDGFPTGNVYECFEFLALIVELNRGSRYLIVCTCIKIMNTCIDRIFRI